MTHVGIENLFDSLLRRQIRQNRSREHSIAELYVDP